MIELQEEIHKSMIIIRNFNNSASKTDRSSRQKKRKDIVKLKNIINQLDKINIYRLVFLPFFPSSQRTYTKIDHILVYLKMYPGFVLIR